MTTYTNRSDVYVEGDPDETKLVGAPTSEPAQNYPPGATGETSSLPGRQAPYDPEDMTNQPAVMPADPRLGMNPQGGWTREKIANTFPEMFKLDTSEWLDPAEEAKKRMGLAYDPNKKYKESISDEGASVLRPRSGTAQGNRIRREDLEGEIFKMYGNPFTMNPYDEVVKADKNLPELFDYIFGGKVAWSDLGRLTKAQREIWEEAKKEFHARTLNEAKAKQQKAENAYKWMMGNYDLETKQANYEQARADRLEAQRLAREGKETTHEGYDPVTGKKMLYKIHADGRIENTGLQVGAANLEERLPEAAKMAVKYMDQIIPKEQRNMINQIAGMNPELAKQMKDGILAGLSPEQRKNYEDAEKLVTKSYGDLFKGATSGAAAPGAPAAAPAGKQATKNDVLAMIKDLRRTDPYGEKLANAVANFRKAFPNNVGELEGVLRSTAPKVATSGSLDDVGSPATPVAPAPATPVAPPAAPTAAEPAAPVTVPQSFSGGDLAAAQTAQTATEAPAGPTEEQKAATAAETKTRRYENMRRVAVKDTEEYLRRYTKVSESLIKRIVDAVREKPEDRDKIVKRMLKEE